MAVILQKLGYEVELVTVNFGCYPSWKPAAESAYELGFPHDVLQAETKLLDSAVETILKEGYPNQGINYLHRQALLLAAQKYPLIADGIRRDDRVPKLDRSDVQSLEDKENVQYLNLTGFGHKTIDQLSHKFFKLKKELTTIDNNSDYEIEIRYGIDNLRGDGTASSIFPEHQQSRVIGWRENE